MPYLNQSQGSEEWYADKHKPSTCTPVSELGVSQLIPRYVELYEGRGGNWSSATKRKGNDILGSPKQKISTTLGRDSSIKGNPSNDNSLFLSFFENDFFTQLLSYLTLELE